MHIGTLMPSSLFEILPNTENQDGGHFEDGGKAVTSPTDASSTDHAKKAKKNARRKKFEFCR